MNVMQRNMSFVLVQLLAFSVLWVSQMANAGSFHVSPNGKDSNPGTQSHPWKTIAKANKTLIAGDTVLIHAGKYSDQIRPENSGTSNDARITYRAAGDGKVILDTFVWQKGYGGKGLIALGGKRFVTVSGRAPGGTDQDRLIIVQPTNDTELYGNFTGSTGCVVENVVMERGRPNIGPGRGWAFGDYWYKGNFESKHNILRNCEIYGYAEAEGDSIFTEDTVTLAKDAHHNLIENCYIGESRHVSLNQNAGTTYKNVFRNNVVENPEHTAMSAYGLAENSYRQDHHLIENNSLKASGGNKNPRGGPGNALQFAAYENIIRYNLITEAGAKDSNLTALAGIAISSGSNGPRAHDNRIYNNTIVHNQSTAIGSFVFGGGQDKGRNRFWNNFLYGHDNTNGSRLLIHYWRGFDDGKDRWVQNVMGKLGDSSAQKVVNLGGGNESLAAVRLSYRNPDGQEFTGWNGFENEYDDKLDRNSFKNYSAKDYHLKSTSPYIDAAAPLTQVAKADSGSGTVLNVEDSRFFYGEAHEFPGWMNVNSDWIAVGSDPNNITSAKKVQIVSVDDKTNTIILSSPIARNAGDFIWLWKDSDGTLVVHGDAPDVGAFEWSDTVAPASAPKPTLAPTPNPASAPAPPLILG